MTRLRSRRLTLAQALPAAPAAAPPGPELRDIHLPPDPSWFPPAPGWWLLAILLLALVAWITRRVMRRLAQRRWQAALQAEVDRIESDHAGHRDPRRATAEISQLLRRAALRLDPPAAAYSGEAWLAWLEARGVSGFVEGPGQALVDAPWRRAPTVDTDALFGLTRRWLAAAFATERPRA